MFLHHALFQNLTPMSTTKHYTPAEIDQLLAIRNNFQALLDEIMENPEMDMSDVEDYIQDVIDDCDGQTGLAQVSLIIQDQQAPPPTGIFGGFLAGVVIGSLIAAIII
jgi:hypothetical protein